MKKLILKYIKNRFKNNYNKKIVMNIYLMILKKNIKFFQIKNQVQVENKKLN